MLYDEASPVWFAINSSGNKSCHRSTEKINNQIKEDRNLMDPTHLGPMWVVSV